MTSDPLDWIARVVMLVLSGMVTLSLIGSIAAIPSGSIETRMGLETQPRIAKPPPLPEAEPEAAAPKMESAEETGGQGAPRASGASPAPAAGEAARWLEAITYALLALVGLAALASPMLWRDRKRTRLNSSN